MELPVKPKKYRVASLDKLSDVVESEEKKVLDLKRETLDLIEHLKEESLYGKSSEKVWIIKGQNNIVNKITYEMNNLQEEGLSMFRNNAAIGSTYRNTKNAVDRGVKFKMIGCVNEKSLAKIKPYLDMGIEFRVYNEKLLGPFGTRFTIFDGKKCRITIGKPEVLESSDYTTVWIESPSLVRMMRIMYMTIWNQCEKIEDYCRRSGIDL